MSATPLRVIIVDDEPLARRGIRARLDRHPDFSIVGDCANGRDAVASIRDLHPDLIFLDVQMPGLSGFDVLEQIGAEVAPAIIFVTAFDTHALHAFEVNALDYLLKPIDDQRFTDALERVRQRAQDREDVSFGRRLRALLESTRSGSREPAPDGHLPQSRLSVKDRGRIVLLEPLNIDRIDADGDYVRVYAAGKQYLLRDTLTRMEQRLDRRAFARIHRSTIVNVSRIRELRPQTNGDYLVVMHDGTAVRSSRNYADRMRAIIDG